jgi:hypothetical protein
MMRNDGVGTRAHKQVSHLFASSVYRWEKFIALAAGSGLIIGLTWAHSDDHEH